MCVIFGWGKGKEIKKNGISFLRLYKKDPKPFSDNLEANILILA